MSKDHFDEFDLFIADSANLRDESKPRTVAEIVAERGEIPTAGGLLKAHQADIDRPRERDPFAVEEAVAQERIRRVIAEPIQPGQVFTPSGVPLNKTATPEPKRDELLYLLGAEIEDSPLPVFESASSLGRTPLEPGPGLHLTPGTTLPQVLDLIGQRAPTAGAREFAKSLAARARELEVA
jgi:hypothetical protein